MNVIKNLNQLDTLTDDKLKISLYREVLQLLDPDEVVKSDDLFDYALGGYILICEDEDDLKWIYTAKESDLPKEEQKEICGGWASIVETPDSFDVCEYFLDDKYVKIILCTNNSGGNVFIVPKELAQKEPNIQKSIELTQEAWG
jgi:hypothetical protein